MSPIVSRETINNSIKMKFYAINSIFPFQNTNFIKPKDKNHKMFHVKHKNTVIFL